MIFFGLVEEKYDYIFIWISSSPKYKIKNKIQEEENQQLGQETDQYEGKEDNLGVEEEKEKVKLSSNGNKKKSRKKKKSGNIILENENEDEITTCHPNGGSHEMREEEEDHPTYDLPMFEEVKNGYKFQSICHTVASHVSGCSFTSSLQFNFFISLFD